MPPASGSLNENQSCWTYPQWESGSWSNIDVMVTFMSSGPFAVAFMPSAPFATAGSTTAIYAAVCLSADVMVPQESPQSRSLDSVKDGDSQRSPRGSYCNKSDKPATQMWLSFCGIPESHICGFQTSLEENQQATFVTVVQLL